MPLSNRTFAQVQISNRMLTMVMILFLSPWLVVIWMYLSSLDSTKIEKIASANSVQSNNVQPADSPVKSVVATTAANTQNIFGSMPATQPSQYVTECKPGAWGKVEVVPIVLELPDEYVFTPAETRPPIKWTFADKNRVQAIDFLVGCGLDMKQSQIIRSGKWADISGGCTVEPGDDLILGLNPEVRSKIYNYLILQKDNQRVIDPYWYRPGKVDLRLRGSELQTSTIDLLKRVLYKGGDNLLLFSDVEPVTRAIKDPAERLKFMKAVSRKRTVICRVKIDEDSDINAMAEYWGADGRQKDIVPLLNSLKYNQKYGIEKEAKINMVCLLPSFARERLYTHPYNREPVTGMKEDCFWTAFNFYSDEPDYKFNDLAYAGQVLSKEYYKIVQPGRLGDLILLADKSGNAIHAAVYICDDIVFTKNGENYTQPWILMHMDDMMDTYRIQMPDVQTLYYRRKFQ